MLRWNGIVSLVVLMGCSDWGVNPIQEETPAPNDDTDAPVDDETDIPADDCTDIAAPESYDVDLTDDCEADPQIGSWDPEIEWTWTTNSTLGEYEQIMSMPVAANLTDDNGDGVIDAHDIPDIVFTSFKGGAYRSPGALTALSGADGKEIWSSIDFGGHQPYGCSGVAIADVDGTGPVIFVVSTGGLTAVNADGSHRWTAENSDPPTYGMGHPSVYDMDADGLAEIILGRTVFNHDGTVRWRGVGGMGTSRQFAFASDLDKDGTPEVVAGNTVYNNDGSIRWKQGPVGVAAVADIDGDGDADVVTVSREGGGEVFAREADGTLLWSKTYSDAGGGPPTIADFDGDGLAEIGFAAEKYYRVLNGEDGALLWENPTKDASSKITGSSVFDFEGDGAAEVVYADEDNLWVYDGATGAVEMKWESHASGTLSEYPIIVDVDGDGSTEIVVASNDYTFPGSNGITVIGDASDSWAPARPIWNQHSYSVTHINDDGTVPKSPLPNWMDHNSFRAGNSEIRVGLEQPDLRLGPPEFCLNECVDDHAIIWVSLENGGPGEAKGVGLAFYALDGATETLVHTENIPLIGMESQMWMEDITLIKDQFGPDGLRIVIDDVGDGTGVNDECIENNNDWVVEAWPCED